MIMDQKEIQARVGTAVNVDEMADMIRSQPIGTSATNVRARSGVQSFLFGPGGVFLTGAEPRTSINK
jgi:hypothetical protein